MTRNYSLGQRYMAYFLVGSLLLQSCYKPTINPPKQVGVVEEVKVPSMALANLEANSVEEETLSSPVEIKQGPISMEQGSQLESSSKLKAVPNTTHQPSFPNKNIQGSSARKPVLTGRDELQERRKLMESRRGPSEKEIPHHSSLYSSDDSSQKTSFSNTLKGIYNQARSSFTKKVNAFSAFLSQEIKEVSALVNIPTVFQINFGEDKAFWRAHYHADIEELKATSFPSLAAQQELLEKQDLVWSGLLSPYQYQVGLQELASSWPAALLQIIQEKWERRLSEQPALLERFLLDDLRTCFQENLQSTWSIETFQDILSFYGQRMNALDYKAQLVYVREAVIKNKSSNVLTIGEEREVIAALNGAIERSSKLERRSLKEERRRFYGQAKELPFFFADEEVGPLGIWNDVEEVSQDKAGKGADKKEFSSSYELGAASLLKSLGKDLIRGIDFAVKHPLEAVVMGLSMQVATAAAMNAFTAPQGSHKTNIQEGPHEKKADKPISRQSLVKRALGDEFTVNQNTTSSQFDPSLTSLSNGNVFVTWMGDQTGNNDIYGRLFDPNGTAISNDFQINQNTTGDQWVPSITSLASGNAFIAWSGEETENYNYNIYGRVFAPSGTAISNDFQINQNTTGDQLYPAITSLANGNAFVTWTGTQTGNYNYDIYGRVLNPSGTAFSNEFPINQVKTGWQLYPSLRSLVNGNVFVTWMGDQTGNNHIYGRLFDPNGTALGSDFQINQNTTGDQLYPAITSLANGNAFIAWEGYQTGNYDIYGRVFGPSGTALGSDFQINQNTTGLQWSPSITSLANGNVFVTWRGDQTGNGDIYGRVFAPSGTALSNEFIVNQVTTGTQGDPSLTSLSNGNVFVTWDGDQMGTNDIYGRILTASFLPPVGITTGGVTTNQPTTAQVTTNGLSTGTPTTSGFQTTGLMSSTALVQPQPSQEEESSTLRNLGIGILGGVGGGAALLTLGSIAAWKYYSYKRNKKSVPQSRENRYLELGNLILKIGLKMWSRHEREYKAPLDL